MEKVLKIQAFRDRLSYLKRIFSAYLLDYRSSNLAFWHTPLCLNNLTEKAFKTLSAYPQNFEDKIGRIKTKDGQGVILLDYKGDLGLQYNPNAIAQLALGYYDKILAGEDCLGEFFTQAAYFLKNGRMVRDDILLWEYNFPIVMRKHLNTPWRSALAQGQGISVCLRAYKLAGDENYLDAAKKAFNAFRYMACRHIGGVLDDSEGGVWLEEYIIEPPSHVLNGFVWALWGVRDYAIFFNDKYAWDLWNNCVKTLAKNIHHYDIGFWTSYDLKPDGSDYTIPASIYYQRLHSLQMEAMGRLTKEAIFENYSKRWKLQLLNPFYKWGSQIWKVHSKFTKC